MDQRLACQEESRRYIQGLRRVDPELYTRVIERRQLYVRGRRHIASRVRVALKASNSKLS